MKIGENLGKKSLHKSQYGSENLNIQKVWVRGTVVTVAGSVLLLKLIARVY